MAALSQPARRLRELAQEQGSSIALVARVIGRSEGYLRRRLVDDYRLDVTAAERETLARFFGVSVRELGG